jgi:hypothetical protein
MTEAEPGRHGDPPLRTHLIREGRREGLPLRSQCLYRVPLYRSAGEGPGEGVRAAGPLHRMPKTREGSARC